ncbi:glycosyltransferase family 2 protein [Vibrio cholerae]|uniref:glycosyltransferase family 2 protein n=1 Tax=Vibrio cholerae TaxID=666 RepID=UPI0016525D2D|nr:glycosyltransferase family A protein [Vibrio cholerae]
MGVALFLVLAGGLFEMLFSIITPCFKSVKTLRRTYESLLKQKEKDFEWILIDDASPDNGETRKLILELAEEAPFVVKYKFLVENHFGTKSVYIASLLASGEFACILDHDDELVSTALSDVKKMIYDFDILSKEKVAGVSGRCVNERGELIGRMFRESIFQANEGDVRFKKKITCELFQFTKVKIINKFFSQMKPGYTNGFCWAKISECYDYVFTNSVLRIYDTYNPVSYSNSRTQKVMYPENKCVALIETLCCYEKYHKYNPLYTIRILASAHRYAILSNFDISGLLKELPAHLRVLFRLLFIPAYIKSKL